MRDMGFKRLLVAKNNILTEGCDGDFLTNWKI